VTRSPPCSASAPVRPAPVCIGLWESATAASTYAYGQTQPAHPDAIAVDAAKPFHKRSSFIRFRHYGIEGDLDGLNPLAGSALTREVA